MSELERCPGCHAFAPRRRDVYTCVVELWQQGQCIDTYKQPFGVRTVVVKDEKFLIKGESILL